MFSENSEDVEPLRIETFWGWNQIEFGVAVVEITGGGIPESLRAQLRSEISDTTRAPRDSQLWKQAKGLIDQLSRLLPQPDPIPVGNICGEITSIPQASCGVNRDIHMQYVVQYTNNRESREKAVFRANELTTFQLGQANYLHGEANRMAWERFNEIVSQPPNRLEGWLSHTAFNAADIGPIQFLPREWSPRLTKVWLVCSSKAAEPTSHPQELLGEHLPVGRGHRLGSIPLEVCRGTADKVSRDIVFKTQRTKVSTRDTKSMLDDGSRSTAQ